MRKGVKHEKKRREEEEEEEDVGVNSRAEGAALVWISTSMHWAAYGCFDVSKPVRLLRGRKACWELKRLI